MEEKKKRVTIDFIHHLPEAILQDIVSRLDIESLCSAAPVCRLLHSLTSQTLSSITTIDLSDFAPTDQVLNRVVGGNEVVRSLTIDCSRLDDSAVEVFAKEGLEELVLLKCRRFSCWVLRVIGKKCPNLRLLTVELVCPDTSESAYTSEETLNRMLKRCLYLESLSIKFHRLYPGQLIYEDAQLILPKTIKSLLFLPASDWQANTLIHNIVAGRYTEPSSADVKNLCFRPMVDMLQSLTLVLTGITDDFVCYITDNLPHLTELCLEDELLEEPSIHFDLTNNGLQSIGSCRNLTRLALTRSKQIYPASFKRVNDIGMLLLAERCDRLESLRLGGFSKVSDAGYISFLHSCKKLRRYEIVNGFFLSDLAFHDLADAPKSLVEVRLISCNLLTSESVVSLSSCRGLEVLDLSGCKSIADAALYAIPELHRLIVLDLGGADITDNGLSALGGASSPIASLCLRNCKRITDRGIPMLLQGSGGISRTLTRLDLGCLAGVSERTIAVIAEFCRNIRSLTLRYCYFITDVSVEALSSIEGSSSRSLRSLDLYHCLGLSAGSLRLLDLPFFSRLRWLGIGRTWLSEKGKEKLMEFSTRRPGLSMCFRGCEIGCKDGWQYHEDVGNGGQSRSSSEESG